MTDDAPPSDAVVSDAVVRRPPAVLAMLDGFLDHTFPPDRLAALGGVCELLSEQPVSDFDAPAARELLARAEVLVGHWGCPTLTAEVLDAAPNLRLFAYAAGTVKWQVTDAVWEQGIVVTSAAAANAVPVAEYTVAAVLLAGKGVWSFIARERDADAAVPLDHATIGNVGRRVGLVGASHVGRLVIEYLRPYELELAVADPFLSPAEADRLGVGLMGLDDLCGWAEVLSLHAPDVEATKGMIGAAQLAALPDGATLVNTARPALVDSGALLAELSSGRISAVLDVTDEEPLPRDHPLRALPNVVLTPHVAGAMGNELVRLADLAIEEVDRYAHGRPALHPVTRADLDRIA